MLSLLRYALALGIGLAGVACAATSGGGDGTGGGSAEAGAGGGAGGAGIGSAATGGNSASDGGMGTANGGVAGQGAAGDRASDAGVPGQGGGGAGGSAPRDGGNVVADANVVVGDAGAAFSASYWIGADITFVQADEARATTYSDGTRKEILQLLKDHGFNAIRLRTFVDPRAADGYDKQQGFGDLAHTVAFGQRIKAAQMGFLLDFHYSDNWADPGKQCVPVAWQGMSLAAMAQALHDYTKSAITALIAGGARPDMVQIGNEITPGMLLHVCDAAGLPTGNSMINGSVANWVNLGTLLKAGASAVREVDPGIKIMLHIDRAGDKPTDRAGAALQTSIDWITNAVRQGVVFDVFGESSYQLYQGDANSVTATAAGWTNTFTQLAARFPNLELVAAEYGPMQREINDVLFNVPNRRGLGTFNWEPTRQTAGNAGHTLFATTGNPRASTADLLLYDGMKTAYASRL